MIVPSTTGLGEGTDEVLMEMAQKNAKLWINYAFLSVPPWQVSVFPDNGRCADAPEMGADAPRNTAFEVHMEKVGEVVPENDGKSPKRSAAVKQCTSIKIADYIFLDFTGKNRVYKCRIETGIRPQRNDCESKERE